MRLSNIPLLVFFFFLICVTDCRIFERKRWRKPLVTWKFEDPYGLLTERQKLTVSEFVDNAFNEWSYALDGLLKMRKTDEDTTTDISISFARRNHSCIESFDGRGGVVAHSTYPSIGILHLDADELWHTGDQSKGDVDLRYVLIHEIGHILGLRHSNQKGSVMRRNYRQASKSFKLSKYDIRAIRKLYN